MATSATNRDDRIELRTTKEEKRLLATAAAYERLDVTSFHHAYVLPTAREVVDRAERIVLSERDTSASCFFLENRRSPLQPCSPPPVAVVPGTVSARVARGAHSRSHDPRIRLPVRRSSRLS